MSAIQLDLFEDISDIDMVRMELKKVKETSENVRRGLFARHQALSNAYLQIHYDMEDIRLQLAQLRAEKIGSVQYTE